MKKLLTIITLSMVISLCACSSETKEVVDTTNETEEKIVFELNEDGSLKKESLMSIICDTWTIYDDTQKYARKQIFYKDGTYTVPSGTKFYWKISDSGELILGYTFTVGSGESDIAWYKSGSKFYPNTDGSYNVGPEIWTTQNVQWANELIENNDKIQEASNKEPSIGMTEDEVLNSLWGEPDKKNIDEYEWGIEEQWVYDGKGYVYFEDGIVTAIQHRE